MIQNEFIGLLESDYVMVKHPITKKEVKLYRIIALRSFRVNIGQLSVTDQSVVDLYNNHIKNQIAEKESIIKHVESEIGEAELNNASDLFIKTLKNKLGTVKYDLNTLNRKAESHRFIDDLTFDVSIHDIGGYVEDLSWFDEDNPSWIGKFATIFNGAVIQDSIITEKAVVVGSPTIRKSHIAGSSTIKGVPTIQNSMILNAAEVSDYAVVKYSNLKDFTMVFENAEVRESILEDGAYARKNSKVSSSVLLNTAHCEEGSTVERSILYNSTVMYNETAIGLSLGTNVNLKERIE